MGSESDREDRNVDDTDISQSVVYLEFCVNDTSFVNSTAKVLPGWNSVSIALRRNASIAPSTVTSGPGETSSVRTSLSGRDWPILLTNLIPRAETPGQQSGKNTRGQWQDRQMDRSS